MPVFHASSLSTAFVSGLAVLVTVAGAPFLVAAQQPDDGPRAAALRDYHGPDREGKDGPLAKAGLDLLLLYHEYRAHRTGDRDASEVGSEREQGREGFTPSVSGVRTANGHVTIDAIATGAADTLRKALENLGIKEVAVAGQVVSGRLPINQIPALARLESLQGASPSRMQTRSDRPRTPPSSEKSPSDTTTVEGQDAPADDATQPPSVDTNSTTTEEASDETENDVFGTTVLVGALAVVAGLIGFLLAR